MDNEKDLFYTLVEKAKDTKLTESEKTSLFSAVDTFVKKNPISITAADISTSPSPVRKDKITKPIKSPFNFNWTAFHAYGLRTAVVVLLVAVFTGGTSFAAEFSLPGDFFYPIKVNFNESLKAAFLPSSKKVAYEVVRAQKRVDEVKQLVAENKLSDEAQETVSTQLNSHIAAVKNNVNELTAKGDLKAAFEISKNLDETLQDGEIALSQISANTNAKTDASLNLEQKTVAEDIIRDSREASTETRENTEDQIITQDGDNDSTQAIAEAKYESVKKVLDMINTGIKTGVGTPVAEDLNQATLFLKTAPASTTESDSITELVARANSLLNDGQEKLDGKEYTEAFKLFREAYDLVQVIKVEVDMEKAETGGALDSSVLDVDSDSFIPPVN